MLKRKLFLLTICLMAVLGVVSAQTVTQTMYFDFGENNNASRGHLTSGADANGHYWNNVHSTGGIYIYPGTTFTIINSENQPTEYSVLVNTRFTTNGLSGGGGLLSPSASLLGDLAIATATEDYMFVEGWEHHNFITFRGLDPEKAYRFYSFGTRNTTETRAGWWEYRGENVWEGYQQIAGSGIGDGGYNGNNNKILVSDPVFPDRDGCIRMTMKKSEVGKMLMLNAMKVEELTGVENPNKAYKLKQRLYLDVGENNNSRGHQTTGADKNGNYWNNMISDPSGSDYIVPVNRTINLVNSSNESTGYKAVMATVMYTNGGTAAGGIMNPSSDLGDMAITTATEDYVWIAVDGQRQIRFTGLNKANAYKFYIYGARDINEHRNAVYTLDGLSKWTTVLRTSGDDIGGKGVQYNVRNIAVSDYMFPDANGNILFTLERFNSAGYGHFNVIKIEEYEGAERPADPIQLRRLSISGTAVEGGNDLAFRRIGTSTQYVAYLKLLPGDFVLKATTTSGESLVLGQGAKDGEAVVDGASFNITEEQVVRVVFDTKGNRLTVLPVELFVKGNIVKNGTKVEYAGNGVWSSEVDMNDGDVFLFSDKYFYFAFNNDDQLAVRRRSGTRSNVAMADDGYTLENIRINRGTYTLTLDMRRSTWNVDAPIDEYKISAFGSSVCNGTGASDNKGYAYLYGQLLERRYGQFGLSNYPFVVSGVSIGGNTTINLLNRYDEMIHDFGRYVIFGLSLGNEGIHGASNQQAIFNQWRDNMLNLIKKARTDGKIPVVMNNYTRADFTASDYYYVKQLNLLIHEWDVPSVNTLGAIDDGAGHWANGYESDPYHPTTAGHQEFFYAMPPSLFDALTEGKPLPVRNQEKSIVLKNKGYVEFAPEARSVIHPFTVAVRVKGGNAGNIFKAKVGSKFATVTVGDDGKVMFTSATGKTIEGKTGINDDEWHTITLTQYYAQNRILLYVDNVAQGELQSIRFAPSLFYVGDPETDVSREFSELFFWRSAFTPEEVQALNQGKMLKSSLEIYSPLSDDMGENVENLAQSLNAAKYTKGTPDGIVSVKADEAATADALEGSYTVAGLPTNKTYKGIAIKDRRKIMVK